MKILCKNGTGRPVNNPHGISSNPTMPGLNAFESFHKWIDDNTHPTITVDIKWRYRGQ